MTDAVPPRFGFKEAIPIVASLLGMTVIVGGALRADGSRDEQTAQLARRVDVLERADQVKTDILTKIDGRTIRIETKLEMMVPAKPGDAR